MTSLDMTLRDQVSLSLRPIVVKQFWGTQNSHLTFLEGHTRLNTFFDTYFKYYSEQCNLIGRHAKGICSSVETHQDIMDIAQLLQQPLTRDEVRKIMSDFLKSAEPEQHDNSINLVARLLLMIKFGDLSHECLGGKPIEWSYGSLSEYIHNYFSCPPTRGHDRIKLDRSFNAMNLQRIGGIEICWTDNLADHLRLMNDDKTIAIFHHVSFLEYQMHNPIFPPHFIEETLRTLALLFPKYDPAAKKWFLKLSSSAYRLDTRVIQVGSLNAELRQIENFQYWHDRLVILKEVYDDARPNNLSQWWYDRRNGPQWYTFWVAVWVLILTVFFGLVQCIEGALQLYKAFS